MTTTPSFKTIALNAPRAPAAVGRSRARKTSRTAQTRPGGPADPGPAYQSSFAIRRRRGIEHVCVDDIDWIEGFGDYALLHSGGRTHLLRTTMTALQAKLDPERLWRVHRSAFVNRTSVREVFETLTGVHVLRMSDGARVRVSRKRSGPFIHKLRTLGFVPQPAALE